MHFQTDAGAGENGGGGEIVEQDSDKHPMLCWAMLIVSCKVADDSDSEQSGTGKAGDEQRFRGSLIYAQQESEWKRWQHE